MKNTSYAAGIIGFTFLLCGGVSTGLTGCAASSTNTDFGSGDDGGVSKADGSTKHDGGTGGGNDSGTGGGQDTGTIGGGDCTAFCMKESAVTGCPAQAACETNCQNGATQAGANCASQYSAVLTCATTTGMIASCSAAGAAQISGCTTQLNDLTTCIQGSTGTDGGMTGMGTGTCSALIQCVNPCTTQACVDACGAMASQAAVTDYNALVDCLFGTNGTSGACGAMCGTMSTACTNCLNAAQMSGGTCYTQVQTCAMQM